VAAASIASAVKAAGYLTRLKAIFIAAPKVAAIYEFIRFEPGELIGGNPTGCVSGVIFIYNPEILTGREDSR
jgi:hypothetical protein